MPRSLYKKFWQYVERGSDSECWMWRGALSAYGYGTIYTAENPEWDFPDGLKAHRAAWFLMRGPIPKGLTLDHLCRNRLCVNPSHLQPVTIAENVMRGMGTAALNARKTHCKNGHVFDRRYGTQRVCSTCKHEAYLRRIERRSRTVESS